MLTLLGGIFVDKIYHARGKNTKTINPVSLSGSKKYQGTDTELESRPESGRIET